MGIKKTVNISDSSIRFAQSRFEEVAWSPVINAVLSDFDFLLRDSLPDLRPSDWLPIINAYNGHFFEPALQRSMGVSIAACIMDDHGALSIEDLPDEYRVPMGRISKLTSVEQFAVLDVVRRYWTAAANGSLKGDTFNQQIIHLIQG